MITPKAYFPVLITDRIGKCKQVRDPIRVRGHVVGNAMEFKSPE
jgi:hypothetical protein